jgi:hypothetical protein
VHLKLLLCCQLVLHQHGGARVGCAVRLCYSCKVLRWCCPNCRRWEKACSVGFRDHLQTLSGNLSIQAVWRGCSQHALSACCLWCCMHSLCVQVWQPWSRITVWHTIDAWRETLCMISMTQMLTSCHVCLAAFGATYAPWFACLFVVVTCHGVGHCRRC